MTDQANQTAHALFDLIPPAVAPDFLKDYGLVMTPRQAQALTTMLLSLTTYWITCAIRVSIPEPVGSRMHQIIQERIREKWGSRFGLVHVPMEQILPVMEQQHHTWERLVRQGGEPIAVLHEAAGSLATEGMMASPDEQKILAVLLDLVPIEEIGTHVTALEHSLRPII
ncbi:MAG: hypothetical protein OXU40_01000 [Nitrospira sp.]|nr:hypothetical protein [Nitrospira sp.]